METSRLELKILNITDTEFIFRLVNTESWIKNIGDRNIKSPEEAHTYTRRILDNPNICYWIVRLKEQLIPVGIISLVQREYLDHPDIGFALLPEFEQNGYACEAARCVLDFITGQHRYTKILGITLKDNLKSVRLLEKLGLRPETGNDGMGNLIYSMALPATGSKDPQ